jgi:hypothetical protein
MGKPLIFYNYITYAPIVAGSTGYYPTGYQSFMTEAMLGAQYHGSRWASGIYSAGDNEVGYGQYEPSYSILRLAQHTGGNTQLENYAVHASTGWRYYSDNNGGGILGYYNYTDGLRLHWTTNGDTGARTTLARQSVNAAYAGPATPITYMTGEAASRETAYAVLGWLNTEVYLGSGHNAGFDAYLDCMIGDAGTSVTHNDSAVLSGGGHIEQWLGGIQTNDDGMIINGTDHLHTFASGEMLTYTGAGYTGVVYQGYAPFMGALTSWTLLKTYEHIEQDSRIIPKIERLCDAQWPYYWLEYDNSMSYRWNSTYELKNSGGTTTGVAQVQSTTGAIALNNEMAPIYWWLYLKTGKRRHLERGDKLFNGTVGYDSLVARPDAYEPPLYNVKEFNELIRWTVDGLEWRSQGVQLYDGTENPYTPIAPEIFATPYILPRGRTTFYPADSAALTTALATAIGGDVIVLTAGVTYTGNFKLRNWGSGADWIYIISSAMTSLPAEGTRVDLSDAANMPTITSTTNAAIHSDLGAHHYRFAGIRIVFTNTADRLAAVQLSYAGDFTVAAQTDEELVHHITFDRCIVGSTQDDYKLRHGMNISGNYIAVVDSYIYNCKDGSDAQAIFIWNGGAHYKIVNNFLEGTAENVIIGGTDPKMANGICSDIEFRGNYLFKRLAWRDVANAWTIKNLFELKNAQRVWVAGNIMENCWLHGQDGTAILLTVRNQGDTAPWSVVKDINIENNIIKNVGNILSCTAEDDIHSSDVTTRVRIHNNVGFITPDALTAAPRFFVFGSIDDDRPATYVTITNNTMVAETAEACPYAHIHFNSVFRCVDNLICQDNIMVHGSYNPAWVLTTNSTHTNNGIIMNPLDSRASFNSDEFLTQHPGDTKVADITTADFVDFNGENYRLDTLSPLKGIGTGGSDPGVDMDILEESTAGTVDGNWFTNPYTPLAPESFATAYSLPTGGTTYNISGGSNFQTTLNNANPGDVIVMQAGHSWTGNFALPNKGANADPIYIISSALSSLPDGKRVASGNHVYMPKIVSTNSSAALYSTFGCNNYRFAGIEFDKPSTNTVGLIMMGYNSGHAYPADYPTGVSQLPYNITFDRCIMRSSSDSVEVLRGIMLGGRYMAAINCNIFNIKHSSESQAIHISFGKGPYLIDNNYLEGAGENFMAGGEGVTISGDIPADITFTRNHCFKRLSWSGVWEVKNLFELKRAQRVLVEGNVFENNWVDGQNGTAILFTARNQSNDAPWSVVRDVMFRNNKVINSPYAFLINGEDDNWPSAQNQRITIENNLFDRLTTELITVTTPNKPLQYLTVTNNTMLHNTGVVGNKAHDFDRTSGGAAVTGLIMMNNIFTHGNYETVFADTTGYSLSNNGWVLNPSGSQYATNVSQFSTRYPNDIKVNSITGVGFSGYTTGNYKLLSTSPFYRSGSDNSDIGVNWNELQTMISGTTGGIW